MTKINHIKLTSNQNPLQWLAYLSTQAGTVFFDSRYSQHQPEQISIICTNPSMILQSKDKITTVLKNENVISSSKENPFTVLHDIMHSFPTANPDFPYPFCGGAAGYFAYDLAYSLENIPPPLDNHPDFYDMYIGLFHWAIIIDHFRLEAYIVGMLSKKELTQIVDQLMHKANTIEKEFALTTPFQSELSFAAYQEKFTQAKHYITAGDCYQINLSQLFHARYSGSPWTAYTKLCKKNPTPYAAFINQGNYQILSCSPERFIQLKNNIVTTKPIKGTTQRDNNPDIDAKLMQVLYHSEKDRAENVMIVDLLRNDLSKNCKSGSVKVPHLFEIESYNAVHHLVSTVTAELKAGKTALDVLRGCFPGGSITGAPKIRAMEIIAELEQRQRQIYCGSIGYISFSGDMDTNIAIRTLLCKNNSMYVSAGGGLVYDSNCEAEYQECLTKLKAIFTTLATNTEY